MDERARFTAKEREFVYGVAMKYMKDEEKAHDVTQDALLLAYRHRDSFRGDSRFTTWLYRIAATTALMHLRKDRRVPLMTSIDGLAANDDQLPRRDEPRDQAVHARGQLGVVGGGADRRRATGRDGRQVRPDLLDALRRGLLGERRSHASCRSTSRRSRRAPTARAPTCAASSSEALAA